MAARAMNGAGEKNQDRCPSARDGERDYDSSASSLLLILSPSRDPGETAALLLRRSLIHMLFALPAERLNHLTQSGGKMSKTRLSIARGRNPKEPARCKRLLLLAL